MEYSIWNNKEEVQYRKAYQQLDDFFENLYHHYHDDTTNISSIQKNSLTYREGQNSYALDIMETIKNKSILLIQAGVGIGKSFGYLLPIFYTYHNVEKFNHVVISTSSIALQQQLEKDIKKISEMLNIKIKTEIAKGINNYACLKRIDKMMDSHLTSKKTKEILKEIQTEIEEIESSDQIDLCQISEEVWKSIKLQNRGSCSNCTYSKMCPFYKKEKDLTNANIIITNHANMARSILDDQEFTRKADMIVFDESHKLEENMRNIQIKEIRLDDIQSCINRIRMILNNNYEINITDITDTADETEIFMSELIKDFGILFSNIRLSASRNFSRIKQKTNNEEYYSITDSNFLAFKITPIIEQYLNKILFKLRQLFKEIELFERKNQYIGKNIEKPQIILKNIYNQLLDMTKKDDSNYIYWTSFYRENRINICCAPKENIKINQSICSKEIPIVYTSGTLLDNQNSYYYFSEGIGINKLKNRTVIYGEEQASPYDYEHNSLFYYNPNLASPKDYDSYILDLAVEINELIRATEGKSLVLFTSKKCMNEVFNLLTKEEYPFELLLQTDTNTKEMKEKFSHDINSCLFATGAFWEGIDVKGKSLSHVIITHLPFDQVDAITQYKASKYIPKEQFKQVYFPNMLIKLEQAIGRLIRNDKDTGIVSCLDSRFEYYKNSIIPNLPMKNYTTNKSDVYNFSEEKILEQSKVLSLKK